MFFPVSHEDEQVLIPDIELRVIESTWGHFTMFTMTDRDREAIDTVIGDLLSTKAAA